MRQKKSYQHLDNSSQEDPTQPTSNARKKSRHRFPIMKSFSKTILSLYILVAALFISPSTADGQLRGAYDYLKEKYDDLPDNGKFATGAVAGFGVSRLAIKSATGVVKIAGAAFVA